MADTTVPESMNWPAELPEKFYASLLVVLHPYKIREMHPEQRQRAFSQVIAPWLEGVAATLDVTVQAAGQQEVSERILGLDIRAVQEQLRKVGEYVAQYGSLPRLPEKQTRQVSAA